MLIARAPVRISLAGGGTDLAAYYQEHGGLVVSTSIDKYFYIFVSLNDTDSVQISSSDYRAYFRHRRGEPLQWDGDLSLPRAFLHEFGIDTGISLFLASEVPPGTGLGSSSAVSVALAKALSTLCHQSMTKGELAELASFVEIDKLGMPIGRQDQYAAAFGGLNVIRFGSQGVHVEPLNLPRAVVQTLERRLMLFFTGASRDAASILKHQQASTRQQHAATIESLHHIKAMAEATIDLLRAGQLDHYGSLLHESWAMKKRLAQGITNSQIDQWYDIARAHGALGGKLTGAGGGGFLMLYCGEQAQDAVTAALEEHGLVRMDFRFDDGGAVVLIDALPRVPNLFPAEDVGGGDKGVTAVVPSPEQARTRRQNRGLRLSLFAIDLSALAVTVVVVGPIREALQDVFPLPPDWDSRHLTASMITVPVMLVVFWLQGRFDLENSLVGPREYGQIVHAVGSGVLLAIGLSYFTSDRPLVSRSWLVLTWALAIVCVSMARFITRRTVHWLRRRGSLHTRVVIVGASTLGVALADQFRAARSEGIDVVGFIDEYIPRGQSIEGVPVVGRPIDLIDGFDPSLADEYILVPQALPHQRLEEISRHVASRGGPVVRMAVSSTDLLTHGFVVAERSNIPLLTLRRARLTGMDFLLKRVLDVSVATIALLVLVPLAAGLVIGRALAGQRSSWTSQAIWTTGGGVTWLRLLTPDVATWPPIRGTPALLAVLVGHLSLVGPRPRLWEPGETSSPPVSLTAIAPGLTGPWRLAGPGTTPDEQDLADLTYVRNYSIWEDFRILWRTTQRLMHGQTVDGGIRRWYPEIELRLSGDERLAPTDDRIPL